MSGGVRKPVIIDGHSYLIDENNQLVGRVTGIAGMTFALFYGYCLGHSGKPYMWMLPGDPIER